MTSAPKTPLWPKTSLRPCSTPPKLRNPCSGTRPPQGLRIPSSSPPLPHLPAPLLLRPRLPLSTSHQPAPPCLCRMVSQPLSLPTHIPACSRLSGMGRAHSPRLRSRHIPEQLPQPRCLQPLHRLLQDTPPWPRDTHRCPAASQITCTQGTKLGTNTIPVCCSTRWLATPTTSGALHDEQASEHCLDQNLNKRHAVLLALRVPSPRST
mmetsp:Transcript_11157/g.20623  ORF Transcript_11157/g.20623 Transcript_11157/m.20623 type:complete len:208 (-) Transcript_11157:32-655(-)